MKLNRLLACVFAGIIAVSCSTENGTETTPEEGLPTAVRVKVEKKGTRATGDLTAVEALESTVNDVTVLVFRGDGTKDGGIIKAVPDSEGMVEVLNTTAGTRDFIVVANAPDGIFDLSMNKSAAESAVMTLLSSQVPDKLVMAGTVTETLEPADDPSDNEIEVSISRMAARVALTGIEIDIDRAAYPDAALKITSVCMNNVNIKYNVKGDAAELKNFSEDAGWGVDFSPAIEDDVIFTDNTPYFYVGANVVATANDNPAYWTANGTEMVLHGTFKESASSAEQTVSYVVKVNRRAPGTSFDNGSDASLIGTGIHGNTKYSVSVKITGPASGEQYPAHCQVTVKVNNWKYVGQSTEF